MRQASFPRWFLVPIPEGQNLLVVFLLHALWLAQCENFATDPAAPLPRT